MDTIKFIAVWAVLSSLALGLLVGWLVLIQAFGLWFLLLLPVLMFGIGLCFSAISWASERYS